MIIKWSPLSTFFVCDNATKELRKLIASMHVFKT